MAQGGRWDKMRAPVGFALLSAMRSDIQWHFPFQTEFFGQQVGILQTPSLQIKQLSRAYASKTRDLLLDRQDDGENPRMD